MLERRGALQCPLRNGIQGLKSRYEMSDSEGGRTAPSILHTQLTGPEDHFVPQDDPFKDWSDRDVASYMRGVIPAPAGRCTDMQWSAGLMGWTRCRRCDSCLQLRRWSWFKRAVTETWAHPKTWFVTLTFRNKSMLTKEVEAYELIKIWIKRTRRRVPYLKYICATEYGSLNGRLHYHLLMHGNADLTGRRIRKGWSHGISEAKKLHVDPASTLSEIANGTHRQVIKYVLKYIVKDTNRIRASGMYGVGRNVNSSMTEARKAIVIPVKNTGWEGIPF